MVTTRSASATPWTGDENPATTSDTQMNPQGFENEAVMHTVANTTPGDTDGTPSGTADLPEKSIEDLRAEQAAASERLSLIKDLIRIRHEEREALRRLGHEAVPNPIWEPTRPRSSEGRHKAIKAPDITPLTVNATYREH